MNNFIIKKPLTNPDEYKSFALWCNKNGYEIKEDKDKYYAIKIEERILTNYEKRKFEYPDWRVLAEAVYKDMKYRLSKGEKLSQEMVNYIEACDDVIDKYPKDENING